MNMKKQIPDSEIWKDIPGYVGLYKASSHGRVKSMGRDQVDKAGRRWVNYEKILHQHFNKATGYLHTTLYKNKVATTITIHRIVAITFYKKGRFNHVNHKDCDKLNNHKDNLEWCTKSHNQKHAYEHGKLRLPNVCGIMNGNAKFTERQIKAIRKSNLGNVELGRKYSVASNTIRAIKIGKTWKHVLTVGTKK